MANHLDAPLRGVRREEKIFLLSPANVNGKRAGLLKRPEARFDLALRLRQYGAPLGEVFSFMSGLYFRGKLAYARSFSEPSSPEATLVITSRGLVSPDTIVTLQDLDALAAVAIDSTDPHYVGLLTRDAQKLAASHDPMCSVILLGSIATTKYLAPLESIFGERLLFPEDFIGRGDLSRGGLLLRAVADGKELSYRPVGASTHHGRRPQRLACLRKEG